MDHEISREDERAFRHFRQVRKQVERATDAVPVDAYTPVVWCERRSILSGVKRYRAIPSTRLDWVAYERGALIQQAFRRASDDQREFVMTGITPEEWDATIADD